MEKVPVANSGLKRTTHHGEIRRWIERYNGSPAEEHGTSGGEDENQPGVLTVRLPGVPSQRSVDTLSWDQFFDKFERAQLAFEYPSSSTTTGEEYRFVPRAS